MSEDEPKQDEIADRRGAARKRTLQKGDISFLDSHASIECVILDISETGARLRPVDVKSCPEKFRLRGPDGRTRLCELIWRTSKQIGVRFV